MANIKLAYTTASDATITLASLASDTNLLTGRESAAIDNTSSLYLDILVSGKITTGTSPTASKTIEVWAVGSWDGINWPDVFDGTDSAETITSIDIKANVCNIVAAMATNANSNTTYHFGPISLASIFGGKLPPKVSLFVTHNTAVNLNATSSNHQIRLQPVYETLTGTGTESEALKLNTLTFNGSTTTFSLASGATTLFPASAAALIISLNGVVQEPGVDYTVSGSDITFTLAPILGTDFFGVCLNGIAAPITAASITSGTLDIARIPTGTSSSTVCIGNDARLSDTRTPTDNTVSTAKLQDDAVTYAKLQNVSATDRLLGRSSAGAGDVEEIVCGSFGRSLIGSADAASARTTLSVQPTASPAFTGAATVTNDGNVVPLTVTNTGTANSFVVNDASGDTSPFVIDADGNVGIGGAASSFVKVHVLGTMPGNPNVQGFRMTGEVPSTTTGSAVGYVSFPTTQAASFTVSQLLHFSAAQGTFGAGSSVTNQFGFIAQSSLTGATNNYGFYSDIASGTGRFNFYANGTAANYFAGPTTITSPLTLTGTVAGNVRALKLQTSGVDRWQITPGFDAESGSNAGSTLWITRWSDAGAFLGTPIAISRATGSVTMENPLFVQGGSTSAPGVAFSGDGNTGIAQLSTAGADTISLVTAGSERLRISSTGAVGISTDPVSGFPLAVFSFATSDANKATLLLNGTVGSGQSFAGIRFTHNVFSTGWAADILCVDTGNFGGILSFRTSAAGSATATPTERMRIAADGNVRIRTGADIANDFYATKELAVIGSNSTLVSGAGNVQIWTNDAQAIDRGGMIALGGKYATQPDNSGDGRAVAYGVIKGAKANSTLGSPLGYLAFGTNNGTGTVERMRIDGNGNMLVGTSNADPIGGNVEGVVIGPTYAQLSRSGALPLLLHRKTNDGDLAGFWQEGVFEGSISVAGTTISYNAFCGSHWAQLIDGSRPAILRGTVLETIDEMCEWPEGKSDRLVRVKVSDTPRSRRVYGVFMAWDEDYAATGDMYATALGAYMVRVSGTVQSGDLLESAGDGTARTQSDDIVRSSTIGKVSSTHRVEEYDDGSFLVPCVLMCG